MKNDDSKTTNNLTPSFTNLNSLFSIRYINTITTTPDAIIVANLNKTIL